MIELKPCPCCNGKATCFAEYDGYRMRLGDNGGATTDGESEFRGVVGCEACGLGFEEWHDSDEIMFDGCEEPDEFEAVLERHMAAKWNTRWERTCHMNYVSLYDEEGVDGIECDECGWSELYDPGYPHPAHCPGCGAKVVGE